MKRVLLILGFMFGLILSFSLVLANSSVITTKDPNCHKLYWVDNVNTTCGYKEFCGAFGYQGLRVYVTENECIASSEQNCHFYYYTDNKNEHCDKKKFCNLYMYQGLQTFDTKEECLSSISTNKTIINECNTDEDCEIFFNHCDCQSECTKKVKNKIDCTMYCSDDEINNSINQCKCQNNKCTGSSKEIKSNDSSVKIMPETASKRAIERLGQLNFTIELKEVGQDKKSIYELKADKETKLFGIFKKVANIQVQIDAETGEIINIKKPWWTFL